MSRAATVLAALWLAIVPAAAHAAEHVLQISVDGLSGILLQGLLQADTTGDLAGFRRFLDEGASTFNARADYDYTITLPNHTSMLTGRPVLGPGGHGWTSNDEPPPGVTLHGAGYIASTFDVAHDRGRTTALYASKSKFVLFEQSYPTSIDRYVNASAAAMHQTLLADLAASHWGYAFVHYSSPDDAGHASGWGSAQWNSAVRAVDDMLEGLFAAIAADPELRDRTLVILTADHGGTGTGHSDPSKPANYAVPFFAWGDGVQAGADLYALNAATRADPGTSRPSYTTAVQPIRNGDGANLALAAFGLPAVPGSSIDAAQDLRLGPVPRIPIFPPLDGRAVSASP